MSLLPEKDIFFVYGLSHKTAPLAVREQLACEGEELEKLYNRLLGSGSFHALLVLSTCNRFEVYAVAAHPEQAGKVLEDVVATLWKQSVAGGQSYFYRWSGPRAMEHLFRVTSGLDSMILGEPQITGQVKEAYSLAVKLGATHPYLNKLVHHALHVSKKVRTHTDIQRQPVSVPYAAVVLAEQIFGELRDKTVFLVGAGQMSELAAEHLREREIKKLVVINRDPVRARELAQRYGGHSLDFEKYLDHLHEADIVLTSTSARHYLIDASAVREAMRRRKNEAMFFIDIGVPRDVNPAVNELMNVYLFDIDDLQQVVDENLEERARAALRAQEIIRHEVGEVHDYLKGRDAAVTIRNLSEHLERMRDYEAAKLTQKLDRTDPLTREAVLQALRSLTNKILHQPLQWLKDSENQWTLSEREEAIRQIFGLKREPPGGDSTPSNP